MKLKTVSTVAVFATAFMALQAPEGVAQRARSTFVGTPQPQSPPASQQPINPIPSSVILPMSNPIAPMGNPVAPVLPFVRYGTTPTVVVPEAPRGGNRGNNGRGRGRDTVFVPVPVPTYYYPSDYYPEPRYETVTVPGQLPTRRYEYSDSYETQPQGQVNFNSGRNPSASTPPASTFVGAPQTEYYTEPRMIINEPRPNRVVVPPTIGTSRADVVARMGQPWGSFQSRGQETLYFDGVTVVLGTDGRVIQIR
jgi:hypothetical protein